MELANVCGIETKYVLGAYGVMDYHAWNLVKLDDGEWYHVDVTYADSSHYGKYNYDKNQLESIG